MNIKILKKKIANKKTNIGLIGVGYVAIKLLLEFSRKGYRIYCYDIDYKKLENLKKGISPISYISNNEIEKIKNKIVINRNFENISECDIIIICLPTPLKKNKPDLSHIHNVFNQIKKKLRKWQTIILESTTYPGSTEEIFKSFLERKFQLDKNFFLIYSPERENPGMKNLSYNKIPKVVSGLGTNSKLIGKQIYSSIFSKIILTSSIQIAELTKLLENIYRSINIALINELKMLTHKLGLDLNETINAAKSKPFGFAEFRPGPGVGGHCIPIDPLYLSWLAKKNNFDAKFIKLASEINIKTTKWCINQINKNIKKFNLTKILLIGIAYKKNIEDTRESAGIKIFEYFKSKKMKIDYFDPYVKKHIFEINKKKKNYFSINKKFFKKYDAFIICADHDIIDYNKLKNFNKVIFDIRGRYNKVKSDKIISI